LWSARLRGDKKIIKGYARAPEKIQRSARLCAEKRLWTARLRADKIHTGLFGEKIHSSLMMLL
jgi:hypothetical protein